MGRKKVDRSDKLILSFELTRPLKERLKELAERRGRTVSYTVRQILEDYFERREDIDV